VAEGRVDGVTRGAEVARRVALAAVVMLAAALIGPPAAAQGVRGPIAGEARGTHESIANQARGSRESITSGGRGATASGVRASVRPLKTRAVSLDTAQSRWQPGRAAISAVTDNVHLPVAGRSLLDVGAVSTRAGPGTGEARVAGLKLLSHSTLGAGVIETRCVLSRSEITGGTATVHLRVARQPRSPGVNTAIAMAGVASGTVDRQTATYDRRTGKLTWTIRGLDLTLRRGALGILAGGRLVVAESTCAGTVTLDAIRTDGAAITPGRTVTPTVTVTGEGDVAAPHTVITIPAPPAGYTLGRVTTSGGGTCKRSKNRIRCTQVTVPGSGSVTVALPVTLAASGWNAANWSPRRGKITAVSTPIAALTGTKIRVRGSGPLATVARSTGWAGAVRSAGLPPLRAAERVRTAPKPHAQPAEATRAAIEARPQPKPAGAALNTHGVGDDPATPAERVPSAYSAGRPPPAGRELSGPLVLTVLLAAGSLVAGIVVRNRPRRRSRHKTTGTV